MKKTNKQKGITLIALVITIIILIILAGITISSLSGSGLFENAQKAKEETYKAQVKEEVTLAITELTISYYNGEDVQEGETLDDYISRKLNGYTTTSGATLTYDNDNKKIVYTDKKGNVTNVAVDDKWNVTVEGTTDNPENPNVAVSSIVLNKESTIIEKGKTETLTATVEPDNATNKEIVWSSENEEIATVENGVVTAVSEGTTRIKATAQDGSGVEGSCAVTVIKTVLENAEAAKPAGATITVTDASQGIVMVDSKNNEWVWVEVPKNVTEGKTTDSDIEIALQTYAGDYREGSSGQGYSWTDEWYDGCGMTETEYNTAKSKMLQSIKTNGGFWISRYEAGIKGSDTDTNKARLSHPDDVITDETISTFPEAVSQANMIPYNYVYCSEAQTLASGMSTDTNKTSSLLFGIQWDLVCRYLEVKGRLSVEEIKGGDSIGSKNWGNYSNSSIILARGKYNTSPNSSDGKWLDITAGAKNGTMLLTTGASDYTNKMNIYDFAGNEWEWTLEHATSNAYGPCAFRGGFYGNTGSIFPASNRYSYGSSTHSDYNLGFRSTLY